jgi:adenine/guanine/hypoxanthine permease
METQTKLVPGSQAGFLETRFAIRSRGSTVGREMIGALATFLTLSYILFVQPFVMSLSLPAGVTPEQLATFQSSVLTAVCLASALGCLVMGWMANFPVALAPGMGHNFFFSLIVCKAMGFTWQQALAANVVAGGVFLVLSLLGLLVPRLDPRVILFHAMPKGLQSAIGVGIGLLIAFVGLEFAGIVIPTMGGMGVGIGLGHTPWGPLAVAMVGLLVFGVLWARGTVGTPLWAILASALVAAAITLVTGQGLIRPPTQILSMPTLSATAFHLDFAGLFRLDLKAALVAIATFLFLDVFDTVGTLAAVCGRAGLVSPEGKMDKGVGSAFFADATGTVAGALLGTSTITSYVESLAGIQAGARTGLAAIGVAALFVVAMFFAPLFAVVAAPYSIKVMVGGAEQTLQLYPCLAAVLIGIGALMLYTVRDIDWDDPTEALPAFLCMIMMPLTMSITDGISFGFISYTVLKVCTGRYRQVHPFIAVCAALLALRYAL